MKPLLRPFLPALMSVGLVAAGCGSDETGSSEPTTGDSSVAASAEVPATTAAATAASSLPPVTGEITVFAAASLSDAFTEVGEAFTAAHPDAEATFSFDASSALVSQITQGAPADVFASADPANMDKLTAAGLNGSEPVIFATNVLSIIVPPGNPQGITGVADLAEPDNKVVLCAAEVPCGKYAGQVLEKAGLAVTPVSLEQNVKGVVTKVTVGEADAGIVYDTDVTAAGGDAEGVAIPADINVVAQYPIATVRTSNQAELDQAFIEFLTGSEGQAIMAKYGFGKP